MSGALPDTQFCSAYACPNEYPCERHPTFPPAEKRLGGKKSGKETSGSFVPGPRICRKPGCTEVVFSTAARGRYANLCEAHYDAERGLATEANARARELPDLRSKEPDFEAIREHLEAERGTDSEVDDGVLPVTETDEKAQERYANEPPRRPDPSGGQVVPEAREPIQKRGGHQPRAAGPPPIHQQPNPGEATPEPVDISLAEYLEEAAETFDRASRLALRLATAMVEIEELRAEYEAALSELSAYSRPRAERIEEGTG